MINVIGIYIRGDITGAGGGGGIPSNALLWDNGTPILWDDGTYILWA